MKLGLTEEQLQERLKYITATDAPTVCGVNPYGNRIELFKQKVGLALPEDLSDNPYIKAGLFLEEPIAQMFSHETGKQLMKDEALTVHPSIPYLAAHTDRIIANESAILECKTASSDTKWGKNGENRIPDNYLVQIAFEAMCFDVERVYIAVLIRGLDFRYYTYERNDKFEQMIIKKCEKFRQCVQTETSPEPQTAEEYQDLHGKYIDNEEPQVATGDIQEAIDNIRILKDTIDASEKQKKALEDIVKIYMGKKSRLLDIAGRDAATWRATKDINYFDKDTFQKEQPELYKHYMTTKPGSRRFVLKGVKK